MARKIRSYDRPIEEIRAGRELFSGQRETVERDNLRTRPETAEVEHPLRVVDRNLSCQYFVQNRGYHSDDNDKNQFLHKHKGSQLSAFSSPYPWGIGG